MKKRLLSVFLALCLTLGLLPGTALAVSDSGDCGSNVKWTSNRALQRLALMRFCIASHLLK